MGLALPVNQRAFFTRQFTRVVGAEARKFCSIQGVGQYSIERLPTDSIGSFELTLNNLIVGSAVSVEAYITGQQLHFGVAASATEVINLGVYQSGDSKNDLRIKVRKGTSSPYYRPYETRLTAIIGDSSQFIDQQADE